MPRLLCVSPTDIEKEASLVEVVQGFNASLPCTIRIPVNDAPLLTLWYLGEQEGPVYSYDQRTGVSGYSWADPAVFAGRAHYMAHLSPPVLLILRVAMTDSRLYRCRIDFHNSNSREAWVRLRVIVPPERVQIITQSSPVVPGQLDDVVCTAVGGNPSPSVVWLQNGRVVDPNSTVGQSGTYNRLEVPATRDDLFSPFTCQASNNELTAPVAATFTRNVTCGPSRIILRASDTPLVVGKAAKITCRAIGSNPPAKVTWYNQGQVIKKLQINVTRQDTAETISILSLQPGRHHHGRQLVCRAENPLLPLATLENIITLNVAYRPHVRLDVDWPRRLDLLTEGSDLVLECIVDANPPPYRIQFFQDGFALNPNTSERLHLNEDTLEIQHVTQNHSGTYHCKASNAQGDASSRNLTISVRYVPVCALNTTFIGASIGQVTSLTCSLHAYPTDVNFTWMFSADRGEMPRIIDPADYSCEGLESTLHFTPREPEDFGEFSCYGTNKQGIQQKPCTFELVPAGPPEEVKNCSIDRVTSNKVAIVCHPGRFDGGYPQQFNHQVREASTGDVVFNKSSNNALLEVDSLQPGKQYVVSVIAFNARGSSPPRNFEIKTPQEAKMHVSQPSQPSSRKFTIILGIGGGIILTIALLLAVLWLARGRRSSHTLRNRDIDVTKPINNTELAGEARGMNDSLCINGLMTQTIYDSSGRYKGFAHIKQMESCQNYGVSSTTTTTPQQQEKPTLQSRLSLLKRDSVLGKGSKASASENGAKESTDNHASNSKEKDPNACNEGKTPGDDEMKKSGFTRWKWVVSHVSTGGESNRFLDMCRLAQSKHSQEQNKNSESVL